MHNVDLFLQGLLDTNQTPSVQYYFFNKDNVIHHFSGGLADIEKEKKISEKTNFNAFSVTKTFTALAVLQLMEKQLLDIDQPVNKYLPDFPYSPDITIRQLLSHSAGIPNPIPLSWIHLVQEHSTFNKRGFFDAVISQNKETKFGPNEKFSYSNLGYVLLERLIEKVTGIANEKYIQDNILATLDLLSDELSFVLPEDEHAKGYHKRFSFSNIILSFLIDKTKFMDRGKGSWQPFKNYYINGTSYGGLIGTPYAFVKYIQELLKTDCKLISDEKKEMIFTENKTRDHKLTGMSLSWFCGKLKEDMYYSHAGGGGGYYCEIRIYPETGFGSVIMFNRTGMTDQRILNKTDVHFM